MGFLSGFKLASSVGNIVPATLPTPSAVVSPWQTGELSPIVVAAEVAGFPIHALTRLEALKVPSVTKGRALLHSLITSTPLKSLDANGPLDQQPAWLYRSDNGISPFLRMANILDDHIFNEASLLAVRRGTAGQILDAVNVPYDRWNVNASGVIEVDNKPVDSSQVIYIPGPGPGLLAIASDTIRAARDMDKAWMRRVKSPVPATVLQEVEEGGMTKKEATEYVKAVATALRESDGAVFFLPASIKADFATAAIDTELFENGRNALRVDVANFLNLPASLLDGSVSEASLTYSTQEGRRNEVFDYAIRYWTASIEQTLSLDNVVPRGQRVRFDWTDTFTTTPDPTGPAEED